jgi:hypothetical protein
VPLENGAACRLAPLVSWAISMRNASLLAVNAATERCMRFRRNHGLQYSTGGETTCPAANQLHFFDTGLDHLVIGNFPLSK